MPEPPREPAESQGGIALFMVLAAVAVLSVLVTEFVYVSNINQKLAFDGLDQVRAHYLAKSGLKLSLLRLKAYQNIKGAISAMAGGNAGAANSVVPKGILEKIWSFPFSYPIPMDIPGLAPRDKDAIDKFTKSSAFDGSFSSVIASESARYNLNMLVGGVFVPSPQTSSSPAPATPAPPPGGNPNPNPTPSPSASPFSKDDAAKSLSDYLTQILLNKNEEDQDFAAEYRDFRMEDFMDNLRGWVDWEYQRHQDTGDQVMKKGPFYSITEMHMIPMMDDQLYDLFEPALTATPTRGINVNGIGQDVLHALVPQMTKDEIEAFFKFRDSTEDDNMFKAADDFFKWVQGNVGAFSRDAQAFDQWKQGLAKNNVNIVTDESEFKIVVRAQAGQTTRTIEAWVTLGPAGGAPGSPAPGASPAPKPPANPLVPSLAGPGPQGNQPADPGLKITFMRIL